jgi:hypothetical protein
MLKVEQTLTCDICGGLMNRLTIFVRPGTAMQKIDRGPIGVTNWHDVCFECHIPLVEALAAVRTAKAAE